MIQTMEVIMKGMPAVWIYKRETLGSQMADVPPKRSI
jgi:hypothetical protein